MGSSEDTIGKANLRAPNAAERVVESTVAREQIVRMCDMQASAVKRESAASRSSVTQMDRQRASRAVDEQEVNSLGDRTVRCFTLFALQ